MKIHAGKLKEKKSQPTATIFSQKQNGNESTFQFVDNRPEGVIQRKLQEMGNPSSQVEQLRAFHETVEKDASVNAFSIQKQLKKNDNSSNPIQFVGRKKKKLSPAAEENRQKLLAKQERKFTERQNLAKLKAKRKTEASELLKSGLQQEIIKRNQRSDTYLKGKADDVRALNGDKRPNKPKELTKKDDQVGNLTAHHLYPYNKIREDFGDALENKDLGAIQNFLSFTGRNSTDSSEAYRLLSFQKEHTPSEKWKDHQKKERDAQVKSGKGKKDSQDVEPPMIVQNPTPDSSSKRMDSFFREATWSKHNLFMGPAPKQRADDPHEALDLRVTPSGEASKASNLAKMMDEGGGFAGMNPTDFNLRTRSARFDSEKTHNYDPKDWIKDQGMYSQKGRDEYFEKQRLLEDQRKRRSLNFWGEN